MESKPAWHFDDHIRTHTQLESGKRYALLPAGDGDKRKVVDFYVHAPVAGYEIASVEIIYNPSFDQAFHLELARLHEKKDNPAFAPKWSVMEGSVQRQTVMAHWEKLTEPYTDVHYQSVKLLPAWHGTRPMLLDSIFRVGYSNLSLTDDGYFGKGLYSTYEADYAYRVYSKGALIVNWVASFSALPVINGDMPLLRGKSNHGNYDAHFVPVAPRDPDNANETVYYPCKPNQSATYHEIVVFQTAACLPRYLVQLQKTLLNTPVVKPSTVNLSFSWEQVFALASQIIWDKQAQKLHLLFPVPAQAYWTTWHEHITDIITGLPPIEKGTCEQLRTSDDQTQMISVPSQPAMLTHYANMTDNKKTEQVPASKASWILIKTYGKETTAYGSFFAPSPHQKAYQQLVTALEIGAKGKADSILQSNIPLVLYRDDKHNSFLHLLAQTNWINWVDTFLKWGFKLTDQNHFGDIALHYACGQENLIRDPQGKMASALIEAGSPVNARNKQQQTPLMVAARCGHLEAIQVLLANHADTTLVDQHGQTAYQLAQASGLPNITPILQLLSGQTTPTCLLS